MVAKTGNTFDDEKNKFQDDAAGDVAVNVIVSNPVLKVDISEDGDYINVYSEANAVTPSGNATILNYTVPAGKALELKQIDFGGDTIGIYKAEKSAQVIRQKRTWWGKFDGFMQFNSFIFSAGTILKLTVDHSGIKTGDFYASFEGRLIDA